MQQKPTFPIIGQTVAKDQDKKPNNQQKQLKIQEIVSNINSLYK